MYEITKYSYDQAKKLGVDIKPSTNKKKKIDVFKNDKKIASIGAKSYSDFPNYVKEKGLTYAKERQRLYKLRHAKTSQKKDSPSFFASKILW